jgi:hypothetical protein
MKIGLLIVFLAAVPLSASAQTELTVTAVNRLNIARQNETIEVTAKDLASLAEKDLTKLHVRDSSGKEVLAQSVDTEPMDKSLGMQGLAIVANPREVDTVTEDNLNHLLMLKPTMNTMPISYWAGFAWDRAGKITTKQQWEKYVDEFSQMRQSPIEVKVK